ncbi:MAG TPA: hypothetical protein VEW48_17240 [Thermoanaerobaculia bacterium]|nr:hypothetical protein [Thermoanaerobaculia bacterium]
MQTHKIRVIVPEDHRAVVEFPEEIRSGPVDLIVLVPPEDEAEESRKSEGQGRMAALATDLAKDPRPFRELSPEERSARLERVMGVGRGLMSTSEEFAQRKIEEIELEEQKLGR